MCVRMDSSSLFLECESVGIGRVLEVRYCTRGDFGTFLIGSTSDIR